MDSQARRGGRSGSCARSRRRPEPYVYSELPDDVFLIRIIPSFPAKGKSPLTCRVHMSLQGFEWFVYNRTVSYDNIVAQMETDHMPSTPAPSSVRESLDERRSFRMASNRQTNPHECKRAIHMSHCPCSCLEPAALFGHPLALVSSIYKRSPSFFKRFMAWIKLQLPHLDPMNLLPVSLEATKGAIICGNPSTPSLLVADFSRAEGTYGIVKVCRISNIRPV